MKVKSKILLLAIMLLPLRYGYSYDFNRAECIIVEVGGHFVPGSNGASPVECVIGCVQGTYADMVAETPAGTTFRNDDLSKVKSSSGSEQIRQSLRDLSCGRLALAAGLRPTSNSQINTCFTGNSLVINKIADKPSHSPDHRMHAENVLNDTLKHPVVECVSDSVVVVYDKKHRALLRLSGNVWIGNVQYTTDYEQYTDIDEPLSEKDLQILRKMERQFGERVDNQAFGDSVAVYKNNQVQATFSGNVWVGRKQHEKDKIDGNQKIEDTKIQKRNKKELVEKENKTKNSKRVQTADNQADTLHYKKPGNSLKQKTDRLCEAMERSTSAVQRLVAWKDGMQVWGDSVVIFKNDKEKVRITGDVWIDGVQQTVDYQKYKDIDEPVPSREANKLRELEKNKSNPLHKPDDSLEDAESQTLNLFAIPDEQLELVNKLVDLASLQNAAFYRHFDSVAIFNTGASLLRFTGDVLIGNENLIPNVIDNIDDPQALTQQDSVKIKRLEDKIANAKEKLERAEAKVASADSLIQAGEDLREQMSDEIRNVEKERKILERDHFNEIRPLEKQMRTDDKELFNKTKNEIKEIETKYKAAIKSWDAKYKSVIKEYESGGRMIDKGNELKKKAKDTRKEAERGVKEAENDLEKFKQKIIDDQEDAAKKLLEKQKKESKKQELKAKTKDNDKKDKDKKKEKKNENDKENNNEDVKD